MKRKQLGLTASSYKITFYFTFLVMIVIFGTVASAKAKSSFAP